MAGRTRMLGIVAVVVVVAGLLAFLFLGRGDGDGEGGSRAAAADPAAGRRHATTACGLFEDVIALVEEDAQADAVLDRLEEAEKAGADAARADPQWIDLSGALSGLEVGLREDDAGASRLSLSVARAACDRLRSGDDGSAEE